MKSNRSFFISLLSVISCFSVVILHTNVAFWKYSTERYWKTSNIIETFFYFAVPCFFMISGATLMDYNERYNLKEYFIKRIRKTVIPFFIWSIIGFLFYGYILKTLNPSSYSIKDIYNSIMSTSIVTVYWFFPHLFVVYLGIPVFAAISKDKRKEIFTYLAIAGFILNAAIPFANTIFKLELKLPITVSVVSKYLIFVVIGYLLNEYELSKKWRIIIYCCAIFGFFAHLIGTYNLSTAAGKVIKTYKGYYNMMPIMQGVGVFVFFKYNSHYIEKDKIKKIVFFLSKYTFGVYLIHKFILDWILRFSFIDNRSLLFRLGTPFIILAISIVIITLVRKIPFINKLLFP